VLPAAEISVVGVLEQYRGKHMAHNLIDAIHHQMNARGDALGLCIGIPNFYERWHYEYAAGLYLTSYESEILTDFAVCAGKWDQEHSYERRAGERLGAHNRAVTVRTFESADLPAIQALYSAESQRGHYLVARDVDTWMWQLEYMTEIGRNRPGDFLVAELDGEIAAYARLVTSEPVNWFSGTQASRISVIESAGDQPDAVEALLGVIGHMAQDQGEERIGLFVHPQSALMRHALARGGSQREATGACFMRLHNLQLALELLQPTFEARRLNSRYFARACRLIIQTEHERGEITFGVGMPDIIELDIPSSLLIRLITGWYGMDHIPTGYHERHANVLRILFPAGDPKIGLADLI
jgi:predicted acetyltransferase